MSDIKIKSCPFCGGVSETFHIPENDTKKMGKHPKLWKWNYPGMWVIGCNTDMCMGNINHITMIFTDEESAIKAWNQRKPRTY